MFVRDMSRTGSYVPAVGGRTSNSEHTAVQRERYSPCTFNSTGGGRGGFSNFPFETTMQTTRAPLVMAFAGIVKFEYCIEEFLLSS